MKTQCITTSREEESYCIKQASSYSCIYKYSVFLIIVPPFCSCFHSAIPPHFQSLSPISSAFPPVSLPFLPPSLTSSLSAMMTEMQAEGKESAELKRDAQLGQHNCLWGCVYMCVSMYVAIAMGVCVCERESLLQSRAESDKETDTDPESKVVRHCYNYTNYT